MNTEALKPVREAGVKPRFLALDGARGLFMALFMAFHFGVSSMVGAWIGLNFFFVLSAHLIVSILLLERSRSGRINALAFYRRRARRLLPALTVLLLTVSTYSWLFQSGAERKQLGGDVLATQGFFINWRLVRRADDYFGNLERPSLLRHLWTLSVEEQFYVTIPLLLSLLFVLGGRRRQIVVSILLALWSAWRMAEVGIEGIQAQAHSYYGTDTRLQAFAIGTALAIGFPLGTRPSNPVTGRWLQVAGWAGLSATLVAFFTIPPFTSIMFEHGGLLVFCLIAAGLILGGTGDTKDPLVRVLSNRFLVWLGVRAYGLYLWHWPVFQVLRWHFPTLDTGMRMVIATTATVVIAAISYKFLEEPVMKNGLAGISHHLNSARILAVLSILIVVGSGFLLRNSNYTEAVPAPEAVVSLVPGEPDYVPRAETIRVGLFGDSVASGVLESFPANLYPDLQLFQLSVDGCEITGLRLAIFDPPIPVSSECTVLLNELPELVHDHNLDVVVMLGLQSSSLPHLDAEGQVLTATDPEFLEQLDKSLSSVSKKVHLGGADTFLVVNLPCRHGAFDPGSMFRESAENFVKKHPELLNEYLDPKNLNSWLNGWAVENNLAHLDLYSALACDTGEPNEVHGIQLFPDGMHYSAESATMLWTWLAPRVQELVLPGN